MLKSECTPEEWAVFAAERRKKDASADAPIKGADVWLSKGWLKLNPQAKARQDAKPSRFSAGECPL